jgi:hypothetical protein
MWPLISSRLAANAATGQQGSQLRGQPGIPPVRIEVTAHRDQPLLSTVGLPKGQRPFRVHVDPMHDGAEEIFNLGDRIRAEFYQRIGFADLLTPAGS